MSTLGPYALNTVYTGDARDLAPAIPDNSVDLVFSDPVYANLVDYVWLAETAARVLRPGGSCLAWCSNVLQYDVHRLMSAFLDFQAPLVYVVKGGTFMLFSRSLFVWHTPCLWFSKGAPANEAMPDTVISGAPPANGFKWNKNPEAFATWLRALVPPAGVVVDFFAGEGSVPVACKALGFDFWASEIVPERAAQARRRLERTRQAHRLPFAVREEQLALPVLKA